VDWKVDVGRAAFGLGQTVDVTDMAQTASQTTWLPGRFTETQPD
jgi:hypothetical protein